MGQTKWWDWPATHKSHRMLAGAAGSDPEIHISVASCACLLNCMQNEMMSLISSTPKIKKSSVLGFCAENRVMLVPQSEHHPRIWAGTALWTLIDQLEWLIWWYLMKNGGESEEDFEHTHARRHKHTHRRWILKVQKVTVFSSRVSKGSWGVLKYLWWI